MRFRYDDYCLEDKQRSGRPEIFYDILREWLESNPKKTLQVYRKLFSGWSVIRNLGPTPTVARKQGKQNVC